MVVSVKAGVYLNEKHIDIQDIDKPTPEIGEALIKVSAAGICGTDMMIYYGKHPRAQSPLVMGHEFSGVIEALNGETHWKLGQRVVIEPTISCGKCTACVAGDTHVCVTLKLIGIDTNGGFATHVSVPYHRLHAIPDTLSDTHAALTEPVAVAVHTVRRSNVKVGDTVVVLGAGPIGLLVAQIAQLAGATKIFISDISPYRLETARQLGFQTVDSTIVDVVEVVKKATNGEGAAVVFEVAGNQVTAKQMIDVCRTSGQIVIVSVYKNPPTVDFAAMHFRELSLTTTRCYYHTDFIAAIDLMASGKIALSSLISHELPLDQLNEGFLLMKNPESALKIIIHPNREE